jgi:hypothetical protein
MPARAHCGELRSSSLKDTPTPPSGFRKNNRVGTVVGARRGVTAFWSSMSSAFPKLARRKFERDTNGARMMLSSSIATAGAVSRFPPYFTSCLLPSSSWFLPSNSCILTPSPRSAPHAPVFPLPLSVRHHHGHGSIPRPNLI